MKDWLKKQKTWKKIVIALIVAYILNHVIGGMLPAPKMTDNILLSEVQRLYKQNKIGQRTRDFMTIAISDKSYIVTYDDQHRNSCTVSFINNGATMDVHFNSLPLSLSERLYRSGDAWRLREYQFYTEDTYLEDITIDKRGQTATTNNTTDDTVPTEITDADCLAALDWWIDEKYEELNEFYNSDMSPDYYRKIFYQLYEYADHKRTGTTSDTMSKWGERYASIDYGDFSDAVNNDAVYFALWTIYFNWNSEYGCWVPNFCSYDPNSLSDFGWYLENQGLLDY